MKSPKPAKQRAKREPYSIAESQAHTREVLGRVIEATLPRLQGWLDAAAETDPAGALALYRRLPPEMRRMANLREPHAPDTGKRLRGDAAGRCTDAVDCVDFLQGVALGTETASDVEVEAACKALDVFLPDAAP
jgi:hypothetical protein